MSGAARFKQQDLTRALKGVSKAGLQVSGMKIAPNGEIFFDFTGKRQTTFENEWDEVLKR